MDGGSLRTTALKFGVSHVTVKKAADREGWAQNFEEVIRRKVAAKVTGIVSTETTEKRAAAIEVEADMRLSPRLSRAHLTLPEKEPKTMDEPMMIDTPSPFAPKMELLTFLANARKWDQSNKHVQAAIREAEENLALMQSMKKSHSEKIALMRKIAQDVRVKPETRARAARTGRALKKIDEYLAKKA